MRTARRVSGLTTPGIGGHVGEVDLLQQRRRRLRQSESERRTHAAVPRAEQLFAEAAPLPLGRHHGVGSPRGLNFLSAERQTHRHRRVVADDGRSLAHDPEQRLPVGIVRIAPVLPIPAQTAGGRGVRTEDTSIERLYAALVLRPVPIDFWHCCVRVSSLGASAELYRDGRLSVGLRRTRARGRRRLLARPAAGGARLGCAVPTGTFHGFVGAPTPGAVGAGFCCAAPPGGINGAGRGDGPGLNAGMGTRPAAAAAAIAGSSI